MKVQYHITAVKVRHGKAVRVIQDLKEHTAVRVAAAQAEVLCQQMEILVLLVDQVYITTSVER
jgi:hypothetical protein